MSCDNWVRTIRNRTSLTYQEPHLNQVVSYVMECVTSNQFSFWPLYRLLLVPSCSVVFFSLYSFLYFISHCQFPPPPPTVNFCHQKTYKTVVYPISSSQKLNGERPLNQCNSFLWEKEKKKMERRISKFLVFCCFPSQRDTKKQRVSWSRFRAFCSCCDQKLVSC